jgi:hypothetical protein
MQQHVLLFTLAIFLLCSAARAQPVRDGTLFDAGTTMSERNTRAPAALDSLAYHVGAWDVRLTTHPTDSTTHTASCQARITYANRGFAYMERLHCADFDGQGHELNTLSFLTFNAPQASWRYGIANSFRERIAVYEGSFEDSTLVLRTAGHPGGSGPVVHKRLTVEKQGTDQFTLRAMTSSDGGETWTPVFARTYTRRADAVDFMATGQQGTYGIPAPDAPDAARQFDFLIGTWTADQELQVSPERTVQFTSTATAVHALNGYGILEHNWADTDPNFPDAAFSVIRIYNRAMRRWESLYMHNRTNSPLFFGGRKEGDDVVLHYFEIDTGAPNFSYFIFHDIQPDRYSWRADTSTDHGATFSTTWTIEAERVE